MILEINGLKYQKKVFSEIQTTRQLKIATMIGSFAALYGGISKNEKQRPQVNIVKEFELIQHKKSKLSKRERDYVVFKFNQNYELIK